jgi:mRNA interferase MazF
MVPLAAGSVILVPFPFSDLSRSKLRPAVVLADAKRGDWIHCQVTSKPYADPDAVLLRATDFSVGSLQLDSYARPGKLFTAHQGLVAAEAGKLKTEPFGRVIEAVVRMLQSGTPAGRKPSFWRFLPRLVRARFS